MSAVPPGEQTAASGVFVTLEGVDGSGKSTKAALLAQALAAGGREVVSLREPGGTLLSEKIRRLVLDPAYEGMSDECELLLYEAARAQLVREVIEPALARGAVVVCDRFLDSTFAYQAGGRCLPEELVRLANRLGSCGLLPHRTIVFDVDPSFALERATKEGADRMEAEGVGLQRRVRAAYLRLAEQEPDRVRVVDGNGPVEEVYGRMVRELVDLLPLLASEDGCHA